MWTSDRDLSLIITTACEDKLKLKNTSVNKKVFPEFFTEIRPSSGTAGKLSAFDQVSSFYNALAGTEISGEAVQCRAEKLGRFILQFFGSRKYALKEGALSADFYRRCLRNIREFDVWADDDNVLLISLKQMMHILRASGIVKMEGNRTWAGDVPEDASFYDVLFRAFWNTVKWEDIFPEDPEAAGILQRDKMILMDILLHKNSPCEITSLSNEFFDLTGFASKNDIKAVSFLDFYLFSWLERFNIIKYSDDEGSIFIVMTPAGRSLFSGLF